MCKVQPAMHAAILVRESKITWYSLDTCWSYSSLDNDYSTKSISERLHLRLFHSIPQVEEVSASSASGKIITREPVKLNKSITHYMTPVNRTSWLIHLSMAQCYSWSIQGAKKLITHLPFFNWLMWKVILSSPQNFISSSQYFSL